MVIGKSPIPGVMGPLPKPPNFMAADTWGAHPDHHKADTWEPRSLRGKDLPGLGLTHLSRPSAQQTASNSREARTLRASFRQAMSLAEAWQNAIGTSHLPDLLTHTFFWGDGFFCDKIIRL